MFRPNIKAGIERVLIRPARGWGYSGSRPLSTRNPGQPLGNAPLYISLAGLAGLSYYVYTEYKEKSPAKKELPPLIGALNKDAFVDFPLKRVNICATHVTGV